MGEVQKPIEKVGELVDLFGEDITERIRRYYRIGDQTKIVWMQVPAHRVTYVQVESGFERIIFEEIWIPTLISYLVIAYSQKRDELFIAGELEDDDHE
ncbi:MAG: hypothetical protein AAFV93_24905 [Chloroflexota bacterium]